ncbi:hypothetical protein ACSBR2_026758 [Camellia fascicularis]
MPMPHPPLSSPPLPPPSPPLNNPKPPVFDASLLQHELNIPPEFIWPDHEKPSLHEPPPLFVPPIDLGAFLSGDPHSVSTATRLVDEACKKHGFFLVINHGVSKELIDEAHKNMDLFFDMPLTEKQKAQRKVGDYSGYSSSFTGRYFSKLPWKENLSFRYCDDGGSSIVVGEYLASTMGEDFRQFGKVYQDYCEAMNTLSLRIMELLGVAPLTMGCTAAMCWSGGRVHNGLQPKLGFRSIGWEVSVLPTSSHSVRPRLEQSHPRGCWLHLRPGMLGDRTRDGKRHVRDLLRWQVCACDKLDRSHDDLCI